jgi:multicomponent Na+:H+ antiporter subunit G
MTLATVLGWVCIVAGSLFMVVGGIGLLRLPDFYARVHAASITDTVGAWLVLVGLMFAAGLTLVTVKLLFVLVFLVLTSPLASHVLVKAAYLHGLEPLEGPRRGREAGEG